MVLKEDFEDEEEFENGGFKDCIFIEGNRDGYGPDQIEDETMTVGELISILNNYPEDLKVFLRNDRGYSYGIISSYDINKGRYNEDGADLDY